MSEHDNASERGADSPGVMDEAIDVLAPYRQEAARLLKAEMQRRGISGKQLAALLDESDPTTGQGRALVNKINKGAFSLAWAIRALRILNVTTLDLRPVEGPGKRSR